MKLIFGLGNPGKSYESTRHNAGFLAVDELARLLSAAPPKKHRGAVVQKALLEWETLLMVKPQTYMNNSGSCVLDLVAYYKLAVEDILVLYDDIDLPLGTVRIRSKGGAGTHNGMRDILLHIGSEGFPRVRIGVGPPPDEWDLVAYVLGTPKGDEAKAFTEGIQRAAQATKVFLKEGIQAAQQYCKVE